MPAPASAPPTLSASCPVTTTTGRAHDPSSASTTARTIARPPTGARSLLTGPIRVERPAASTRAATFAARAGLPSLAPRRGWARAAVSLSRPPTPIAMTSRGVTSSPAARRSSTRSRPLSFGERAHPGSPSTGRPRQRASRRRFPGSTGIPRWSTSPPAATMPPGMTSRRSAMADAPTISTICAPASRAWPTARATAPASWRQRTSFTTWPSSVSIRERSTREVLSSTVSFVAGSRVWMTTVSIGSKAATRIAGAGPRPARARSSTLPGTANGITLIVASISPSRTGRGPGSVATVSASSTALNRSTSGAETRSRP